ncbi:MAG: hypothetical protein HY700_03835 [Gemmatimonadetes bacterium]|nr:hypothetical protein [Gemmatimonadota bacterium]
MIKRAATFLVLLLLSLGACGGEETPPAGTPAKPATAAATPAATAAAGAKPGMGSVAEDTGAPAQDSTQLQREIFSYRGAGRDPFLSLLKSADIRPLVTDVRVAGITYDAVYPARSVAVLRDTAQNKRYSVRVGDELGRMKVTEIRGDAVVVTLDEFGVEKQVVLPVRRRQREETP